MGTISSRFLVGLFRMLREEGWLTFSAENIAASCPKRKVFQAENCPNSEA